MPDPSSRRRARASFYALYLFSVLIPLLFISGEVRATPEEYCDHKYNDEEPDFADSLDSLNGFSIALGVVIWIFAMVAFLPQHWKLWATRSSEGMSFIMLFLSNVTQFSALMNAFVLKFPQVEACFTAGPLKCTPSLLTVYQLLGTWVFSFPLYWWYLLFYRRPDPESKWMRAYRLSAFAFLGVFLVYILLISVATALILWLAGECATVTIYFGSALGIVAAIVTFFVWTPQIVQTFLAKSVGSFSIPMLMIQAPGTMVVVYFLVFLSDESVTTWIPYLTAGVQQFVLLALLLYYEFRRCCCPIRKADAADAAEDEGIVAAGEMPVDEEVRDDGPPSMAPFEGGIYHSVDLTGSYQATQNI
jgi:uncharacterized protein with PQ loop repeat